MECSPLGSSVHGDSPSKNTGWVVMPSSRGSSQPRDRTQTAGGFFTIWATREAYEYWCGYPLPSPGNLPNPGTKPGSPALQADSLLAELPGKPRHSLFYLHFAVLVQIPLQSGIGWNSELDFQQSKGWWCCPFLTLCDISLLKLQFSCSVVSDSLWLHGPQHASPPCPSPTLEFTQTHVHWVSDAIQPSHPLSSPSPPAFNLSQHQGLFKWVSSSHQVAKVLEFQLQHQSFQRILRTDFLLDGLVRSPYSPRDSQKSSWTP